MRTRQKVTLITMISVLLLVIIGLTIGLVLVAQQVSMNNNMSISYTADNVDATITASATNYANASGTSDSDKAITIGEDNLLQATSIFSATGSTTTSALRFNDTDLTASGRAQYSFTITNTANANNEKILAALFTINNLTEDDNISVYFAWPINGTTNTVLLSHEDNVRYVPIGPGQSSLTINIITKITNATIDVNDFTFGLNIKLKYANGNIDNFAWGNAEDELIIGVKNDSNVASIIGHGIYDEVMTNTLYSNTTHGASAVFAESLPVDGEIGYIHLYVPSGAPAMYTFELLTPSGKYVCDTYYYDGTDGFAIGNSGSKDTDATEYDKDYDKCIYYSTWDGIASFNTDALDGIWDLADNPWEYGTKLLITITPFN